MRARRCNQCGNKFYSNATATSCQDCTGDFDPSVQAQVDAEHIAKANDFRVHGGRKQTLDLNTLRQEAPTPPAPQKGRKSVE